MRAPNTSGTYSLFTRATHHGSTASTLSNSSSVCVDGLAPNPIASLTSSTHTPGAWSNQTTLRHTWSAATDNGCAGVSTLPYTVTLGAAGTPTTSSSAKTAATTSDQRTVSNTSTGYYFNIRVRDRVDYLSAVRSAGPYKIDTTLPLVSSLVINRGAATTASTKVSVNTSGTDTYSGIQYMQFSGNNTNWSALTAYSTSTQTIDLATVPGGSTAEGTKRLYVRFRDHAGNYSSSRLASITYLAPPSITGATASREAVNHTFFALTGSGFNETTYVKFGTATINTAWTSAHENWWATGAFRIVSDTQLYIYPPQGLAPASYNVQTYNGLSLSNTRPVQVVPNAGHILRTSTSLTAGATQTIMVTKAGLKPTVSTQVIMVSLSKVPSVYLPHFKIDLGNNFAEIVFFPEFGFDGNGVSKLTFATSSTFKGLTAYFQSLYLDKTPAAVWPMPVSTGLWSTTYK
jgi:hypothetical protein